MFNVLTKSTISVFTLGVGLSGYLIFRPLDTSEPIQVKSPPLSSQFISSTSQVLSLQEQEELIYKSINQYRLSRNLSSLKLDERISQKAREHSQAMATGKMEFGHDGFDYRIEAIELTIPYQSAVENVAFNQGHQNPSTQAVQGWLQSPSHLANIEGDFNLTGIGVMNNGEGEYYFTQIFIKEPH